MADKEKKHDAPHAYSPNTNHPSHNNPFYFFTPYNSNVTLRDMKKKAEQAMTDHEFKD